MPDRILCDATRPVGDQVARCYRPPGHDGWHTAVIADAQGDAVTDRWSDRVGDGGAL